MNVKYMVIRSRCLICAVKSVILICFETKRSEGWEGDGHIYKGRV